MCFLWLFLFTHFHLSYSAAARPPQSPEYRALQSIKSAVTDDPQSSLASWNPTANCCTWKGVTCDYSGTHVTSLDVSGLSLSGFLSPEVGQLRFLVNLSVADNSLSGPFPPEIGDIPNLISLNLSNNVFNLTFPPRLFRLKSLRFLDLYNNNLTGDISSQPYFLPNLRHLHLGGNFFTGQIPPAFGSFPRLEYLAVSGNELTGPIPPEIGNLSQLSELYIGYFNTFSGGIPNEIGNLSQLLKFDAANCGLSGEIPAEIGNLQNLDTLFLQVNGFSFLSPELGNLKSLRSMDLSNNAFSGEIPPSFANLKNLTLLNLFRNELTGSIPDFISHLPNLQILQLWENNFTGVIPPSLGTNGNLQLVDVSSNKLTGHLPTNICNSNQLHTLIALSNFLAGPIPDSLGQCHSLIRIRLGRNYLTGPIPNGLFSLPNLTQVELQDNLLSGAFPQTNGSSSSNSLVQVTLSNNRLTGPLPPSIGAFSVIQKLLLDGNRFSGRIPSQIGNLQQLSKIDLSHNDFSGPIAPEISRCKLLTFIDLSRNNLSGPIPAGITKMKILNYLNLSRNHLTGGIPSSISSMQSLTSVDFSYNNLSGESRIEKGRAFSPSKKLLIVTGLLVCSIVFATIAVVKARALKRQSNVRAWELIAFHRLDFTCDDVLESLKEDNIIGKGGAGIVYKGVMPKGEVVAVKRLTAVSSRGGSSYHDHGFKAEIQTLGRIRHRSIVRLLGYCSNHELNLLVYEYMPNGSLGELLHGKRGARLNWDTRYKIAVGAAKGLCYLHHDCSPLIVHRDVKSNNILLDSGFEARVADFGLAKFLRGSGDSECMSAIAGSYGYIAPEYAYTLRVDEKSDVYSFGVVLLELLSGRKPVGDLEFGDGVDIVQWVRKVTTGGGRKEEVVKIVDSRLAMGPLHEVSHVFYVAMLCVEEQAVGRPTMRHVVQILTDLPVPPADTHSPRSRSSS